jgi:tRNA threonylcarbamoyladenosine biosynthesis protein TsaE
MSIVASIEELNEFVHTFCKSLNKGDVVILDGDLGAGKTHFVKAAGHFFNVEDEIISPTFPILLEHYGDFQINHFDLYRLNDANELNNIGFYDYVNSDGISFIEWGIKFPEEMPSHAIYVFISIIDDFTRKILVSNWKTEKNKFPNN